MAGNLKGVDERRGSKIAIGVMLGIGGAIGVWATVAGAFALASANWQVGEMLRQYMVAVGMMKDHQTWVEFYTHIKGVEYIICAVFLVTFPVFFRYVNGTKVPARAAD
jgi:hypothetical protein